MSDPIFLRRLPDKHFDSVRIPIEILIVKMFGQLGSRNHFALMMQKVGQQPIFVGRQLDGIAVNGDPARTEVKALTGPQVNSFEACPAARRTSARTRARISSM